MKAFTLLPLTAAVVSAQMLPAYALAASNELKHNQHMEEMTVSASPLEKTVSDNPRPISVLSGEKLRQQAAATLGATLQGQVGVTTASFGPSVGNPIIRGQGANRVKVMQDNLDTLDAANASADHANSTEPLLADSIEVLRGPQTLRFGNGAIGGVVNVIDSRIPRSMPEKAIEGAIETRHTTANDETASVFRLDGAAGDNFAWHVDGMYRDSNNTKIDGPADVHGGDETTYGFIDNSNNHASGGSLGGSWIGERGFLGFSVNYQENNYGIPPGGHEHDDHGGGGHDDEEETVRIDMQQTRYDVKGELLNPIDGFEKARLRLAYVDYEHAELEGAETGTVFESEAVEGRLELVHNPINDWQGAFGIQLLDREFAAIGEEAFIPKADITSQGIFLIEEKQFGQWLIEVGGRLERQDIDPENGSSVDHNTYSLSFASQYQLSDTQRINLGLSRAQRAPSIEELFSDGAHLATQSVDVGDRDLDEETSMNWEVGYHYHGDFHASVNLFYNDISDFIYKRNTGEEDHDEELIIFEYSQEDATFRGIEAELILPLAEQWQLRFFGDYVRAKLDSNGDVPRITPARFGSELSYATEQWDAKLIATRAADQNHPGDEEEKTDGYTRVDASFNYYLDNTMLFVRATNLLDDEIRHSTSYLREVAPEAERSLTVGARFSF
jgi:iron complex outermembrane receptor protein